MRKEGVRIYLSVDEAISVLPEGDTVHTFYNLHSSLIGADWDKAEIINKMKNVDFIEITGEQAQEIGHGLALYNKDAQWHSDILFIETDMEKLAELEQTN